MQKVIKCKLYGYSRNTHLFIELLDLKTTIKDSVVFKSERNFRIVKKLSKSRILRNLVPWHFQLHDDTDLSNLHKKLLLGEIELTRDDIKDLISSGINTNSEEKKEEVIEKLIKRFLPEL